MSKLKREIRRYRKTRYDKPEEIVKKAGRVAKSNMRLVRQLMKAGVWVEEEYEQVD